MVLGCNCSSSSSYPRAIPGGVHRLRTLVTIDTDQCIACLGIVGPCMVSFHLNYFNLFPCTAHSQRLQVTLSRENLHSSAMHASSSCRLVVAIFMYNHMSVYTEQARIFWNIAFCGFACGTLELRKRVSGLANSACQLNSVSRQAGFWVTQLEYWTNIRFTCHDSIHSLLVPWQ